MTRTFMAALGAALLGCGATGTHTVKLDPAQATGIEVALVHGGNHYCASGDPSQLVVTVVDAGGKRFTTTRGAADAAPLAWTALAAAPSWGSIDAEGYLVIPPDPVAALGKQITIDVKLAARADLVRRLELAPDFGCGGAMGAVGRPGRPGAPGRPGSRGGEGYAGHESRSATNGEDGLAGFAGGDGGSGGPGPQVEVAIAYVETREGQRLVALRTWVGKRVTTALFRPDGKSWTVVAAGGAGGPGGPGGQGGDGGKGGNAMQSSFMQAKGDAPELGSPAAGQRLPLAGTSNNGAFGGNGGRGGDGGRGGAGGAGGDLALVYDGRFPELERLVHFDNHGGAGGAGGAGGHGGTPGVGGDGAQRGSDGRPGLEGVAGAAGVPGAVGPRLVVQPAQVATRFADLVARGLTLVEPGP